MLLQMMLGGMVGDRGSLQMHIVCCEQGEQLRAALRALKVLRPLPRWLFPVRHCTYVQARSQQNVKGRPLSKLGMPSTP